MVSSGGSARRCLLAATDAEDHVTRYEYDRNNRRVKMIRPLLQETTYEYDPVGNLAAVLDAKGQKIATTYDAANRPDLVLHYAAGDHETAVKTIDFDFDTLGRLAAYSDGATSAVYTYDDLGRKLTETVDYGPFQLGHAYTYTANGRKQTYTGPDGVTHTYAYDENNRLASIDIPGVGPVTFGDHQWNSPTRTSYPGGGSRETGYAPLMRPQSLVAKAPAQVEGMQYGYQYSPAGNITEKATEHGTYSYGYDELYRLTSADNPTLPDEAFTYDVLGNRLTSADVAGEWITNLNNELQGYGDVSFEYDANGNTVRKTQGTDVTVYAYDIADRLVRVEDGGGGVIAEYGYDPFGRRLWKDVAGVRTYFVYAEEGLVGEFSTTGVEQKTYGYLPGSLWTTNPLYQKTGGQYYWYRNDHLGTPQQMVDSTGAVVWVVEAQVFGAAFATVGLVENNLRFPGQYFDGETGLHYNWFRYFDPDTGSYLRLDPIRDQLNWYVYGGGNPVANVDPLGLYDPFGPLRTLSNIVPSFGREVQATNEIIQEGVRTAENSTMVVAVGTVVVAAAVVAVNAAPVVMATGSVWASSPASQQALVDFTLGLQPGPPPSTLAGAAGTITYSLFGDLVDVCK